ncbi:MAG: L-aspartate oxidase [Oscillospiraceae bacterium]|nr:L-aspartate oxidase [Oscillospiraceae bacterium]
MRYVFNGDIEITQRLAFDVLIIGSGIAGLYTALNIDEKYNCCILTKESVEISNSWLAQGGIAAAVSGDDAPSLHFDDTFLAGAGLCDKEAVSILVEEGPSDIRALVDMKVPFDQNDDGDFQITREGGHRKNRIVHAGGDATGRETVKALARLVAARRNVAFMSHSFFADLLTGDDGSVAGAVILGPLGAFIIIDCPNVVIATGGIGQIYGKSTNPSVATGDGIAAAMRAGAVTKDLEFIQFHPTGLKSDNPEDRVFLVSEAVRGEGGLLKNAAGERFMLGRHELAELAPRDIVSRAIVREMAKTGADRMFIDITSRDREYLQRRFPTIFNECLSRGIDISQCWIPVCPAQHYLIGGIETDLNANTCIPGLYACGEAASTGVHGANRLASNSMLECLVFGRRSACSITERLAYIRPSRALMPETGIRTLRAENLPALRREIKKLMDDNCFVLRKKENMKTALRRMTQIKTELEESYSDDREHMETLNMATVAEAVLTAAVKRSGSVGVHYSEE